MVQSHPLLDLPHAGFDDDELCLNGRPPDWCNPRPREPYHLLVIGAGPAGLVAARAAAALGARVALIEKHLLGGVSLNYGCVPSQALIRTSRLYAEMRNAEAYGARSPQDIEVDFPLAMARMRRIRARAGRVDSAPRIAAEGIDLFFGTATFVGPDVVDVDGLRLRFNKALIATGSRSLLPTIPGLDDAGYLTNESLFDLTVLPKSLLVIGGGPVGCQVAQALCRFGCRTLITHAEPLFLPKEERDAALLLAEAMARDGVEIHLNTKAVNVRVDGGKKIVETLNDGNVATIEVDEILTGIGRAPALAGLNLEAAGVAFDANDGIVVDDFLRTTNRRIFAAGDVCLEHMFTDTAEASARIVVRNALCFGR
ncbi:MAG: FAD-dependent oxidoreductase, partial [Burkholderiales bacterium]